MEKNIQWYNPAFFTEEDINIIKNVPEEDNSPVLHFKEHKDKENRFWKVISVVVIFVKTLWNGLGKLIVNIWYNREG